MTKLEITKEQEEFISNVVAKVVHHYSKNIMIDAIYMNAFMEEKIRDYNPNLNLKAQIINEPNIHLVIVNNDFLEPQVIYDLYDEIKEVRLVTGINLNLVDKPIWHFNTKNMDTREFLACRDLANGTILFDREGNLTKLRESLLKNNNPSNQKSFIKITDPYQGAIEFVPPLQLKR